MEEYLQIFTTIDNETKAKEIAKRVVKKKLAACVQISSPVNSIYRWEGKIIEDKEWLLIFKSSKKLYDELEGEIKKAHTYDVPEILAMPVVKGNEDYLNWLKKELK